ncbi:hypothetical protein LINGRAHAP2_LOCUS36259, partial [Linum grandiflorum]
MCRGLRFGGCKRVEVLDGFQGKYQYISARYMFSRLFELFVYICRIFFTCTVISHSWSIVINRS